MDRAVDGGGVPTSTGLYGLLLVAFTAAVTVGVRAGALGFIGAATAISLLLLLLERWLPLDRERGAANDPQLPNDLGHAAVANGIAQLSDASALVVGALLAADARAGLGFALWPTGWPLVAQGMLAIVLADGLDYWRHRMLHRTAWLWPVHALHHSIDRLHVLKGPRNTFLDMVSRSVVVFGPLAALGAPAAALVWFPCAILVLGPIAHANLDLRLPAFVHRVLVTPPQHRVHHAMDPTLGDANFAVVTPLWDLLFGTYRQPDAGARPAVGIAGDTMPASFVRQALSPFLWGRFAG